jgi:hypothetical protein
VNRPLRLGVLDEATVDSMLGWPHSGFSLDATTAADAADRRGLERCTKR